MRDDRDRYHPRQGGGQRRRLTDLRGRITELKSSCFRDNEVQLEFWPRVRPAIGSAVVDSGILQFHHMHVSTGLRTSGRLQSLLVPPYKRRHLTLCGIVTAL